MYARPMYAPHKKIKTGMFDQLAVHRLRIISASTNTEFNACTEILNHASNLVSNGLSASKVQYTSVTTEEPADVGWMRDVVGGSSWFGWARVAVLCHLYGFILIHKALWLDTASIPSDRVPGSDVLGPIFILGFRYELPEVAHPVKKRRFRAKR